MSDSRMTWRLSVILQAIHLLHGAGIELQGIAVSKREVERIEEDLRFLGITLQPEDAPLEVLGITIAHMEVDNDA